MHKLTSVNIITEFQITCLLQKSSIGSSAASVSFGGCVGHATKFPLIDEMQTLRRLAQNREAARKSRRDAYLNLGEMPEAREGGRDGDVHDCLHEQLASMKSSRLHSNIGPYV